MKYIIYKITNTLNNRFYIGKHQTHNVDDGYMGSGKLIRAAIKKHGLENFRKEILFVFESEEDMNAKEAELVTQELCESDDSYNLVTGGCGGWSHINTTGIKKFEGKRHSEETRRKIGDRRRGTTYVSTYSPTPEHRARIADASRARTYEKGRAPMSQETKDRISKSIRDGIRDGTVRSCAGVPRPTRQGKSHSDGLSKKIKDGVTRSWVNGTRVRPFRDWIEIQKNLDEKMPRVEIYARHGINKNVIDHGIKTGQLLSSRSRK